MLNWKEYIYLKDACPHCRAEHRAGSTVGFTRFTAKCERNHRAAVAKTDTCAKCDKTNAELTEYDGAAQG